MIKLVDILYHLDNLVFIIKASFIKMLSEIVLGLVLDEDILLIIV